jgi:hypothetical protein
MIEFNGHFRWEIEFLKNISSLNILFYSTEINAVELQVSSEILIFEIAGKEINKINLDQFRVKQMEKKQWPDHLQIKIQVHPHEDTEYSYIQNRWQEKLPEVPQLQQIFCKFCHQSLLAQKEGNFEKLQRLPSAHWEEIKDAWWVCACNATALEQAPSIPKGFIRARPGRLLLSESYVLIHNHNLSPISFGYNQNDKALLDRLSQDKLSSTPNYTKSNTHELQVQQWIEFVCSQCKVPVGLKEISTQANESEHNFKFWKHKTLTNLSTEKCFWRNRSVCSMMSSDMIASMTDHGSYRFHLMHQNSLIAQVVVTNWSSFSMSGEDFVDDTIHLHSLRPIIKFSFRDCYSDPSNAKKFENQWRSKYQIEHISYSILDCFELLSTFHQNNLKMPSMCQEFSGMLNSWMYYLPST